MRSQLALLALTLFLAPVATAHDLGVARVELEELEPGRYRLEARLPSTLDAVPPGLPEGCTTGEPSIRLRATVQLAVFNVRCAVALGAGDVLSLPWRREGAFVAARWADGATAGHYFEGGGSIEIPISRLRADHRGAAEAAGHYLLLGVEHILLGWDHLAFVLGLCLIARGWQLAKLVTAFTLGHSLTLAAAVLGLARLPSPPVEASIALSIAFVAREALLRDGRSRHGIGLALIFGLLHGLGFASALAESGIQRSEIFLGLMSFNLGVEVGQLAFILGVCGAAGLSRALVPGAKVMTPRATRSAVAWALGILAAFWTFERALGFAGTPLG